MLTDAGGRRFDLIREVRSLTGHSVRKSTALIDAAPRLLKGELPRDEAEAIKARLEGFGATVELK
ncbi:ribosomal protein L7/L12 [Afifella pfennigii]|uniref:ribosomal protein L7/L12 n=1 Tax=Afifella pfennigii TaxID=209897 RepID=UPI002480A7B9|nr:ribosomal protein L7/L12 [Afifella pfennigii]